MGDVSPSSEDVAIGRRLSRGRPCVLTTWQQAGPEGGTQESKAETARLYDPAAGATYHRLGKIPGWHRAGGDCTRAGRPSRGGHPGTFGEGGRDLCGGGWGASEMAFLVDLGAPITAVHNGKMVVVVQRPSAYVTRPCT